MSSQASRIAAVARQIFGTLPNRGVRTGMQFLKKPMVGPYHARFYPESIEPIARKVSASPSTFACSRSLAVMAWQWRDANATMLCYIVYHLESHLLGYFWHNVHGKWNRSMKLQTQRYCPTIPLYTTEIQERRLAKLRLLRTRGKGPPKKGSGKRSK